MTHIHHRPQQQQQLRRLVTFRGGGGDEVEEGGESPPLADNDEEVASTADSPTTTVTDEEETVSSADSRTGRRSLLAVTAPASSAFTALLASIGKNYGTMLDTRPILTKSVTAGFIFSLSDFLAQRIEQRQKGNGNPNGKDKKQIQAAINWTRLLSSTAIGFFYFGPAAHYWYETIFRLLPGTTLISTLQKAALGQAFFGPTFTCIFFASSLIQARKFSMSNWMTKIRQDLPGAWLAGVGFWPIVDLVSYGCIPKNYIPLFVNMMSLIWTIYLSMVANR